MVASSCFIIQIVFIILFVNCTYSMSCSVFQKSSPTCIVTDTLPSIGAMPSVGNGYVGTVIMSDEIHVSGIFNGKANVNPDDRKKTWKNSKKYKKNVEKVKNNNEDNYYDHTHRARIPSTVALNFSLNMDDGDYTFGLDVQHGVFYQWFKSSHNETFIEQRTYAHRTFKNILITELLVQSKIDLNITLTPNRGPTSVDINFNDEFEIIDDGSPYKVIFGEINETETDSSEKVLVAVVWTDIPEYIIVKASPKQSRFPYITSIVSSLELYDPVPEAVANYKNAKNDDQIFESHASAWSNIWSQGNITVDKRNLNLSQTIYASFYNILSSIRSDWNHGLSPGSLPVSYEYMGHTFWDQDTWMYPSILMFMPEIAQSMLQYRYERLDAASQIAKKYKFKGAMYPWESALSGFEVCPEEVYGRNEIHVTGDISFAVSQYYMATKDMEWLKNYGFPIVYQNALFWSSRVVLNKTKNAYVINDVMPPDEYHYPVNNSVYTNVVAKINLNLAIKYGRLLGESVPSDWHDIAKLMYIPFDETLQYHPEYEGFDITDPEAEVKQADTILINFPLMFEMSDTVKQNDLRYYGNITDEDGPAMTNSMFTIGWLEIGDAESAYNAFSKNFDNIQEPFKVWSEVRGGEGASNFITAAGGYLQALIFGYGGIRLKDDGLYFNMNLLKNNNEIYWNGIKYLGNSLQLHRKDNTCTFRLLQSAPSKNDRNEDKLCVRYDDIGHVIDYNITHTIILQKCKGVIYLC